ncbi:MAG: alpha/beta hydrolase [Acidimicrobiia bacterium]
MQRIAAATVFVLLAFIACSVLLVLLQRRFIYLPSNSLVRPHQSMQAEDVAFHTEDGLTLDGWFIPASTEGGGSTVLVFNGNGGNRGDRLHLAETLSAMGHAVLLFDYRGYGTNEGRPTETGLLSDGLAAVEYVETRNDVDPEKLVYFGESLGTGVAVGVATHRQPSVLILRSPFTSLADAASATIPLLPMSAILWDEFPTADTIGRLSMPIAVIAGTADRTIPIDQSLEVFRRGAGPKKIITIEGADHNDPILSSGFLLTTDVDAFIDESLARR